MNLYNDNNSENFSELFLNRYGTNLTKLAKEGKLEECFGREKEVNQMLEILARKQKNNPVLIGEPGVGKTAIIELFALKLIKNLVPFILEGRVLYSIDLARIVGGAKYRGEFEERFQGLLDEVLAHPNVIIFIDEIHTIAGIGSNDGGGDGALDAANMLKPVLSRSGFQCIGATTTAEYKFIEKDPALGRRFQQIKVDEPSISDAIKIIYGLRPNLEAYHNVEILPGAIKLAVELSSKYITDRYLPDKAIDLIDRAAAREVIRLTSVKETSLVSSVINSILSKLGLLKIEAFRRGDIAVEFILQQIENTYRQYLLKSIENPLINKNENLMSGSAVSSYLLEKIKINILKNVDQLLFKSSNFNLLKKQNLEIKNISNKINNKLYLKFINSNKNNAKNFSLYRINLFLFANWFLNLDLASKSAKKLIKYFVRYNMHKYLIILLSKKKNIIANKLDFIINDFPTNTGKLYNFNSIELKQINIFKNILKNLKPLLRKTTLESLEISGNIELTSEERNNVYTLLGLNTNILNVFSDSKIFNIAKNLGNFNILKKRVDQESIKELVSQLSGIPIQSVSESESKKLAELETLLHTRVIGQEDAISAIAKAIRRARFGLQNQNRPIASFFFCGSTGVGKTEVTKALANVMFGSDKEMIRFDMSEFMEKFSSSKLIGSPPGYIGYEEGGQLTNAVLKKPYSVVLLDEVEKAHPDILNLLLQVLEDGRLTDNHKKVVSFENTIIIMTSNAGADEILKAFKNHKIANIPDLVNDNSSLSELFFKFKKQIQVQSKKNILKIKNNKFKKFNTLKKSNSILDTVTFLKSPVETNFWSAVNVQIKNKIQTLKKDLNLTINNNFKTLDKQFLIDLKKIVLDRLTQIFLPEFLNRLDDIIIFQPLNVLELRQICDIMIAQVVTRVKQKNIKLIVSERTKIKLTKEGHNPVFGARPLRRLITKYVEDNISESLLKNPNKNRIKIDLDEKNNVILL